MPKFERNKKLERCYSEQLTKRFSVPREGIHASHLDGTCLNKHCIRLSMLSPPPPSKKACMRFTKGLGIEAMLLIHQPDSVERDGIWCSVDDIVNNELVEIKATDKSLNNFNPVTTYPWWVHRMGMYAYAYDKTSINLLGFFTRGNYKDIQTEIRGWTISYTKEELTRIWKLSLSRKKILEDSIENRTQIPTEHINPLKFSRGFTECDDCEVAFYCDYYQLKELV